MNPLSFYPLSVGHGTVALSPMPGRGGRYAQDLIAICDWQPDLVISMTTQVEMAQEGAGAFGVDLEAHGISWAHLPIEDFGAPSPATQAKWPAISKAVRQILSGSGRVLVHCRGGCGRSGMIVLRLMVENGELPKAALKRLRDVRPCAVETDGQMAWAAQAARP